MLGPFLSSAWSREHHQEFSVTKMADLFPKYRAMFQHLAKPGYHGDYQEPDGRHSHEEL